MVMNPAENIVPAKSRPPAPLRSRFYGFKTSVARLICHPLIGRIISAVFRNRIPNHGCVIDTDSDEVRPATKAAIFWGIYEGAERRFIRRYLRSDLDVVELGSSLGVVSSHIGCQLKADRRLVCVEANPHLVRMIRKNLAINSPGLRVEVVTGAIYYSEAPLKYVTFSIGRDNTTSQIADHPAATTIEVPAFTLSQLLEKQSVTEYALVCDIEGAEAGMIEWDEPTLRRCRQLIIELHATSWNGRQYTVHQLQQRLEDRGFQLRDQHGPVCVFER